MENLQGSLAGLVCYHDHPTLAVLMQPVQAQRLTDYPPLGNLAGSPAVAENRDPGCHKVYFLRLEFREKEF